MVLARAAMGADLNSLEGVIRHTKRTILYFHPLDDPAPIKRVWCLYEILTAATTEGNELTLGFSSSGKKEMYKIAAAFAQHSGTSAAAAKDVKADAKALYRKGMALAGMAELRQARECMLDAARIAVQGSAQQKEAQRQEALRGLLAVAHAGCLCAEVRCGCANGHAGCRRRWSRRRRAFSFGVGCV